MRRTRLLAAVAAIALLAAPLAAQQPAGLDAIFATWNSADSPGCAVAVEKDGKAVLSRAYGAADLEHGQPNRPATVFEAGSVSKQFTAAAVLVLAGQGKLALDDDVRKYVPELRDYGATITIDHLLSHTSGLRDWGSVMDLAGWPRGTRAYAPADVLDIIARQTALNYAPGAEYSYTNSGFNLLALIVERVSGQTLAAFSAAHLFRPLGMNATRWRDNFRAIVKGRAIAYRRRGGAFEQAMPFEDAYGNGGLLTTTADLLRWNRALAAGELGAIVTTRLQQQARLSDGTPIPYARGLFVQEYRGLAEIAHSGTTAGYKAWLGRWPAERLSLALLCNLGDVDTTSLSHQVIDLFLGGPAPAPTAAVPAAGRAGLYVEERTGDPLTLVDRGGALEVDGERLRLLPSGHARGTVGEIVFAREGFELVEADGRKARYRRREPWTPTPGDLAPLAGRYASEEAGAAYVAAIEDGKLVLRLEGRPQVRRILAPAYRDAFAGGSLLVRVIRGAAGEPAALSLGSARVRDLCFRRADRR